MPPSSRDDLPLLMANQSKKEPLNKQQINKCLQDIEDMHPLRELIKIKHIAPFLTKLPCFKTKQKTNFKHGFRIALMKELALEMGENEEQIQEDPYLILGYGLNAYFDVLDSLSKMLLAITIFMIPVFYMYSMGQAYNDQRSHIISQFMMGSLGGAGTRCIHSRMNEGNTELYCPHGT